MSGKGSGRRPAAISASEADANWARTFGKADSERCKGAPREQTAGNEKSPAGGGDGLTSDFRASTVLDQHGRMWAVDRGHWPSTGFSDTDAAGLLDMAAKVKALNGKEPEHWLSDQPISPTGGA